MKALVGKGEKAPLSSGAEMLRRVAPLCVKSAYQPDTNSGGTAGYLTRPEPIKTGSGSFFILPEPRLEKENQI